MKKIYLFLLLLFTSIASMHASHLVGGDLRVLFRGQTAAGPLYRIVFNLYYDDINGGPSLDQVANMQIRSIRTNAVVLTFNVEKRSRITASYPNTSLGCVGVGVVNTGIYLYDKELVLDPAIFNDSMGYYVVCSGPSLPFLLARNGATINIAPNNFAYYTEFPRISSTNIAPFIPFINSTPDFGVLQGDYLCINQPFSASFGATDADGDELEYDLIDPLDTAPNTSSTWSAGYSLANIFGTSSAAGRMRIDRLSGLLTVTPEAAGLFAFSVRCTERRNGVKIGEIRREFQYLVRSNCDPASTPVPSTPGLNTTSSGAFILDLNNGPSIDFIIKGSKGRGISNLQIIPQSANFTQQDLDISKIFSPSPSATTPIPLNASNGEGKVKLTWPPCLYSRDANDIYEFDFVITDNSCPKANISTTKIRLKVLQRNNPAPKWDIIDTRNIAIVDKNGAINITTNPTIVGDSVKFTIRGIDLGDSLRIRARAASEGEYFTFVPKNIEYTTPQLTFRDVVTADFVWVPQCSLTRNNGRREELIMDILIDERSSCEKLRTVVKVKLVLDDNGVTDDYQPVNVFTPNGDGKNDDYTLATFKNSKCLYTFKKITIHNRLGREVFQSTNELFSWKAKDFPTGLYYYRIEYENYEYKGSLQVLR